MDFTEWKAQVNQVLLEMTGQDLDQIPTTVSPMQAFEQDEWPFDYAWSVLEDLREEF